MAKKVAKFKVGNQVIGNKDARCYNITKSGWIGEVTKVTNDYIHVTGKGAECGQWVDSSRFDLYNAPAKKPEVIKIKDGDYFIATKKGVRGNAAKCCGIVTEYYKDGAVLVGTNLMEENDDVDYHEGFPTYEEQSWDIKTETIKDAFGFATFEIVKDKRQIAIINAHKIAHIAGHNYVISGNTVSFGCGSVKMRKDQAIFIADLAKNSSGSENMDAIGDFIEDNGTGFLLTIQKALNSGLFKDIQEFANICYKIHSEGIEFLDMSGEELDILKQHLTKK